MNYPVDSTSYIYENHELFVPLNTEILNFKYLDSEFLNVNKFESAKIGTEITSTKPESNNIKFKYNDGILFILISLLVIIAFIRISGKNYLHRLFISITNYSYSNSFFKEKNLAFTLNNNLLIFVFIVTTALVLNNIAPQFDYILPYTTSWYSFYLYMIFTLIANIVYRLVHRILGFISNTYDISSEYLFFFGNLNRIMAIVYLILLFGLYFTDSSSKTVFVYITIFITILAFFIKYYRLLVIFLRNQFPLYYMILYFCALEIIPLMLLFKIFGLISEGKFDASKLLAHNLL